MYNSSSKAIKITISYLLLIIWAVVIFMFSAKDAEASTEQSNLILMIISKLTGITIQENAFWAVTETIVRKAAHLSVYLILGILAVNAFRYNFKPGKEFITALIFCVLYAASDEIHQYFIPGRAYRLYDIAVDTFGSCIGITVFPALRKKLLMLFKRSDHIEKA